MFLSKLVQGNMYHYVACTTYLFTVLLFTMEFKKKLLYIIWCKPIQNLNYFFYVKLSVYLNDVVENDKTETEIRVVMYSMHNLITISVCDTANLLKEL